MGSRPAPSRKLAAAAISWTRCHRREEFLSDKGSCLKAESSLDATAAYSPKGTEKHFILYCLLPWEWETLALQLPNPPPHPRLYAHPIASLSQSQPLNSLSAASICDQEGRSMRVLLCAGRGPGDPFSSSAERPSF